MLIQNTVTAQLLEGNSFVLSHDLRISNTDFFFFMSAFFGGKRGTFFEVVKGNLLCHHTEEQ